LPRLRGAAVRLDGREAGAGGAGATLRELEALRVGGEERFRFANRASFASSLGGPGWAALGPGAHYLFTVEAVRRLVARRDQIVKSRRWAPRPSLALTWQTLLNSVTFGHNVALGALGDAPAVPARKAWQRRIDALASVILAIPAMLIALPIELAGAPFGRGAVVTVRTELL
jgi:hypothetical protein